MIEDVGAIGKTGITSDKELVLGKRAKLDKVSEESQDLVLQPLRQLRIERFEYGPARCMPNRSQYLQAKPAR